MLRHAANPILSSRQVPFPSTLTFNAGVIRHAGRYAMVFRNDVFRHEPSRGANGKGNGHGAHSEPQFLATNLGLATSRDGLDWTVESAPILTEERVRAEMRRLLRHRYDDDFVRRIYDPRLTVLDDRIHMCFAVDTAHGICGGVATTEDFQRFDWLSLSAPDNRNMVLFPRRIGGRYLRLERPFPVYMRSDPEQFPIWCAESPDLTFWGHHRPVLGADEVPFANAKVGPAAPPVETTRGWLVSFHAVRKDPTRRLQGWEAKGWFKSYYAGLMLLDRDDPSRVIGLMREPLLEPQTAYELEGYRGSVIFPCGMILEDTGEVKLYYGAADTSIALATAHVDDLVARCEPLR